MAQEIVDGMRDILNASVVLYDAETRTHQLAMLGDRWYSHESTTASGAVHSVSLSDSLT